MDEPTSGVDANSILSIHKLINKIAKEGTTVFITSHNLDEIQKLCDEMAIMKEGNIEIQGDLEKLRETYEDNLSLEIHHNDLNDNKKDVLEEGLRNLNINMKDIKIDRSWTKLKFKDKNIIPDIVRLYVSLDIDVFKVDLEELSLEDIFLRSSENHSKI